jgi:TolB-like protein
LAWWQSHNLKIGVLALAGIICGLALGFKFMMVNRGTASGKLESVAVLPFSSPGGKKADLSLSMRMAEALITKLDSAKKISVRPPAAIRGYYEENTDPIMAGQQLGVDAVITGEAMNQNGRLFVRVRLLRVADRRQLLDVTFDEPLSLPSKLENAITDKITTALEPPGGGQ